jgi:peptidoglycan/xylan/chitin deacetylase (PgdA/CDA1 family)
MTWGFLRTENSVYLTFDDGPDPIVTPWVLTELKKSNAKATFFCTGSRVKLYPELVEQIKKEGHAIGNHTMNHERGRKTKTSKYLETVNEANALIGSDLFRPPYGSLTKKQSKAVAAQGYRIIMWSWLTYDFDEKVSVQQIVNASKKVKKGDVIVMHDNPKCFERVQQILPDLLTTLQQKGYDLKAID